MSRFLGGTLIYEGEATTGSDVGSYSYTMSGLSSSNYDIGYNQGQAQISKATINVSGLTARSKTYDGTTSAVLSSDFIKYKGLIDGDSIEVDQLEGVFTSSDAGVQEVEITALTYKGDDASNYSIVSPTKLTSTINKAPLTITVNSIEFTYTGVPYNNFTVSYDGFVGDETKDDLTGSITFSGSAVDAINKGIYEVYASGLESTNYEIIYEKGYVTILDTDIDGDGIFDSEDDDIDGDGILNEADVDIDGDGVNDNGIDTDGDGINNDFDTDDDGDMYLDTNDAFPLDASEWLDTDSDGIGNNADTDDDEDGQLDTDEILCGSDSLDPYSMALDTDSDNIPNCVDTDDDGDTYLDTNDALPLDASEWLDTDSDGIGNNADTDDDGDGVLDTNDAFPLDATERVDTDSDGIGNNADTDDDGDGVIDTNDAFPLDPNETLDTDYDGVGNNADTDDDNDGFTDEIELICETNPLRLDSQPGDYDNDGIANCIDDDMDGDGVMNQDDAFPLNEFESIDTDGDGIGNNIDADDDNDGVLDGFDAFPLDSNESEDVDQDGIADNQDNDLFNDGFDDSRLEVSGLLTPNVIGIESTWKITNINLHPNNRVSVFDKNGKRSVCESKLPE